MKTPGKITEVRVKDKIKYSLFLGYIDLGPFGVSENSAIFDTREEAVKDWEKNKDKYK
jgi:hypothetical protein